MEKFGARIVQLRIRSVAPPRESVHNLEQHCQQQLILSF